jgi:restriction system protein
MKDINYYMVRAIDNDEALENFTKNNIVAIGWSDFNFSNYGSSDDVIKELDYLDRISPQVAGRHRGQIARFFEIKKEDRILVPYWNSICLCIAKGKRKYNEKKYSLDQSNEHEVEYLVNEKNEIIAIPRDSLSEGLQRRIRVRGMTINSLNEFAEEIESYVNRAQTQRETFSWKINIEEKKEKEMIAFRNKLLDNIRNGNTNLKAGGIGLELLVKELLTIEGYNAYIPSKQTFPSFADADVVASKADKFAEIKILVQVKHHFGVSGSWGIEQLLEIKKCLPEEYKDYRLIFITSADVSKETEKLADENDVYIIDGENLVLWLTEQIKQIANETKYKLGILEIPQIIM